MRLPSRWIIPLQCHSQELQRLYPELRAIAALVLQEQRFMKQFEARIFMVLLMSFLGYDQVE